MKGVGTIPGDGGPQWRGIACANARAAGPPARLPANATARQPGRVGGSRRLTGPSRSIVLHRDLLADDSPAGDVSIGAFVTPARRAVPTVACPSAGRQGSNAVGPACHRIDAHVHRIAY